MATYFHVDEVLENEEAFLAYMRGVVPRQAHSILDAGAILRVGLGVKKLRLMTQSWRF